MEEKVLYTENQRFTQFWLWLLLGGILLFLFYGIYQQIILGQAFGKNPASDVGLLVSTVVFAGVIILVRYTTLFTKITTAGIYYRFWPFFNQYRHLPWAAIKHIEVIQYRPFLDYWGYGLRLSPRGKGTAYIIKGNMGLMLHLKNKSKLLIGTQRPEVLKAAIEASGFWLSNEA